MSAKLQNIAMVLVPDEDPDVSWLEQTPAQLGSLESAVANKRRLLAFQNGEFGFVGVRAVATIEIPTVDGCITETIESPGLWGIESDSGDDYFASVYEDEKAVLMEMLAELGVLVSV